MEGYHDLFMKLQTDEFLTTTILEVEEEFKEEDIQSISIRRLQNLANQLDKVCGDELAVTEARKMIRKAKKNMMGRRATARGRMGSVFAGVASDGDEPDSEVEEITEAIDTSE